MKKEILTLLVMVLFLSGVFYLGNEKNKYYVSEEEREHGVQLPAEEDTSDIEVKYNIYREYTIFDSYWYAYNIANTSYDNYLIDTVTGLRRKFENDYRNGKTTYRFDNVYYTYLDIDKDGTDELIFSTQDNANDGKPHYIDAIYKYIKGGLKKVVQTDISGNLVKDPYEYERLIDDYSGENIYLTEDNRIVCSKNGKTRTYELENGFLKKTSGSSFSVKTDYDWTVLSDSNKNKKKIKEEYIKIINDSDDDVRFDILRMYDENIELYVHKDGEKTGRIIRYDGEKKGEIEVYAPMLEKTYLGILIYKPLENVLETSYIVSRAIIKEIPTFNKTGSGDNITANTRNFGYLDHHEEVVKQYTIDKNGNWKLRGEASYIDKKRKVNNAYYDFADASEEYVTTFQPEELTKEEVLWLLEKY